MKRIRLEFGLCALVTMVWLGGAGFATSATPDTRSSVQTSDTPQDGAKKKADKKAVEKGKTKINHWVDQDQAGETTHKTSKADAKKVAAKEGTAKAESSKSEEKSSSKATTYKLKKRLFKVEFAVDGIFESPNMTEVSLHGDEWIDFEVLKAVEHGTRVKQGEVLVELNMEKIDKVIADQQREQTLAKLALQEAETQLQAIRTTNPLDDALADRTKRISDEDMAYFLSVERPLYERSANFMVKMSEDNLAYEKEELRQLEKMYKADDLVEETEEIILRRARDTVERAKFVVERTKVERDAMLKMTLPRAEELAKANTQKQAIDYAKTKTLLPLSLRRVELTLEKMKIEMGRGDDRLKRLLADRTQMSVKAPAAGIVYYGRCVRGKWTGGESHAEKFRRGGHVMNDEVFMTIVEPQPAALRVNIAEKHMQYVAAGQKTLIQPTAFPETKLTGIVQRVARVPSAAREFEAVLAVALDNAPAALMPGMGCEVRFVPYAKTDALTIPTAAVGGDDLDGRKSLVALPGKEGKVEKREVTLGKRTDKQVEVLKGLAEGDEILAEFPKDKE
jgi:hypothetical protein